MSTSRSYFDSRRNGFIQCDAYRIGPRNIKSVQALWRIDLAEDCAPAAFQALPAYRLCLYCHGPSNNREPIDGAVATAVATSEAYLPSSVRQPMQLFDRN
jgi:hypothetical protein